MKVIAGEAFGAAAAIDTHTPIVFQDWTLEPGADVTVRLPADQRGYVYVFHGSALLGDEATGANEGQLAILGDGGAVRLRTNRTAPEPARLLLLAGVPLNEPELIPLSRQ